MNNNPRPVMSIRKTVQLMVILTLLAWATQTLFAQWGYGGLIMPPPAAPAAPSSLAPAPAPAPRPAVLGRSSGATIELQSSARFAGEGTITLRDVCKWSDADAAVMTPLANLKIAKIGSGPRVRAISVDDIKSRLHDAGANLSLLQFTGAAQCAVVTGNETGKSDAARVEPQAPPVAAATPDELPTAPPARDAARIIPAPGETFAAPVPAPAPAAPAPATSEPIAMSALTAPATPAAPAAPAAPAVEPAPAPVHYDEHLVLTRALSRGQRIIASDIAVKRVVVEQPTQPAITAEQIVGNIASRDMKKGDVFAPADVARPAVVIKGQFMTVAMRVGRFDVETVARALDSAAAGETCRAKNESTGDVYRVVVTAPNEGRIAAESTSGGGVAVVPQQ